MGRIARCVLAAAIAAICPAPVAALAFVIAAGMPFNVSAQGAITTLHTFAEAPKNPGGRLLELPDGRLIGTAGRGGAFNHGAILQFVRDAAGALTATTLYAFKGDDGDGPWDGLVLGADGHLYGSACSGGHAGYGTLFRLTLGGQLTLLYSFQGPEGSCPNAPLVQAADGSFYGTTSSYVIVEGSEWGPGTIFRITPGGTFTLLKKLSSTIGSPTNVAGLFNPGDGSLYGLGLDDYSASPISSAFFRMDLDGNITIVHRSIDSGFRYAHSLWHDADGSFYGIAGSPDFAQTVLFRITAAGTFTLIHPQLPKGANGLVRRQDGTFYFRIPHEPDTFGGRGQLYRVRPGSPAAKVHQFSFSDGSGPSSLMVANDGTIYGTAGEGGFSRRGVVFRLSTTDAFSVQHSFSDITPLMPLAGLVEGPDNALYGTTCLGGIYNAGTVFRVAPAGALTVVHSFAYWDGMCPAAALIKGRDGAFYGTTSASGLLGGGTIFRLTAAGAFTPLHFFTGPTWESPDGAAPFAALTQTADGSLYGTTVLGGHEGRGTVFRLSPSGAFTRLHSFAEESTLDGGYPASPLVPGPDGALYATTYVGGVNLQGTLYKIDGTGYSQVGSVLPAQGPIGQMQLIDGNFYGSARWRNTSNDWSGSVFRITPAGVLTELHAFAGGNQGANPMGGITQGSDGALFGTTQAGGASNVGTIFRLTLDGRFSQLHAFGGHDGADPRGALLRHSSGALYGTTFGGGPGGNGTVFVVTGSAMK